MKLQVIFTAAALLVTTANCYAQGGTREFARTLSGNLGLQGRIMWVDATANIDRVMDRKNIQDIVAHCKKANFTMIVLDVKPVSGQVIYNSKIAEHMREWKGKQYPDFDALAAFIEEGHKAGLEISASFNVFGEGHKYFNVGLAYKKPEWQSVTYIVDRGLVSTDGSRLPIRAQSEPEDPSRATVYADDYVQEPTPTPGKQMAVSLDEDKRVAGIIDPALLDNEPLTAPEDGHLLVLDGKAMDWATAHLRAGDITRFDASGKRVLVTEAPSEKVAAFVNPLNTAARKYEISVMKEVAQNYDVDGIVFDRMRYANLYNDYSDLTRRSFETWLGKPVAHWPEDVLRFDPNPGGPVKRGPLFKPWLEFRARVIREFVREATDTIHAVKPNLQFAAYVGSWFTEYYGVGVNWGSEKFPVRSGWASSNYNEAGYAEYLDWLSTGCYYPIATRDEARALHKEEGGTVEAAADLSSIVVANSVPVYAGLYVLNYKDQPQAFAKAITAAARHSQGVMIFDLSYIYDYAWWNILEQAFPAPAISPHLSRDLTARLRAAQDAVRSTEDARASSGRLPAVPYQPGGG
jgi:uncharacterized lipoprotein YddW (UPF0748 family)